MAIDKQFVEMLWKKFSSNLYVVGIDCTIARDHMLKEKFFEAYEELIDEGGVIGGFVIGGGT